MASGCFALIKRKCPSSTQLLHEYFEDMSHICCKTNEDLGLSSTTQPPPSSRCKAQSCRCKRAHSNTRKPMKNIKRYLLNMAYLNSFKIKTKQKNCPDLANIEFKIASHPSTYPINALFTPRFLLH